MAWIIDEFKVKPGGLFTKWRYKRVLIDNNGNLSNTGVPGEEEMNLPCISNYSKSSRLYTPGRLITAFCNITTFTRYRVYAQECAPFAYVQTDLNYPECGYVAPSPDPPVIPEPPGVPPNPFGDPVSYGIFRFMNFCDVDETPITINIYRKQFAGPAVEVTHGDSSPVKISYKNSAEDPFTPIWSMECQIRFISDVNFNLSDIYTNDQREFKAEVIKDGVTKFIGFVIPDSCVEPFMPPPYPVTIRAVDGLSDLKKVTYPLPSGSKTNLRQKFTDILSFCFNKTDLYLPIETVCNLYEVKMSSGLNDDPLYQASMNPLRFAHDNGFIYNIYEVLEAICTAWGGHVCQVNGAWTFIRTTELALEVVRKRVYNNKGVFQRGENLATRSLAGIGQISEVIAGGEISIGNAYKRVDAVLEFGTMPSLIYNGDFELWDGSNFNFWTRYGGINISRVQNYVLGNGGAKIYIDDYSLQFNEKYNSGKWLEADPVEILKNEKVSFTFNVGKTTAIFARFKMRIKLGDYYLYNEVGTATYEWVKSLATCTFDISNPNGLVQNYTAKLDAPAVPISGVMIIQLFGFSQLTKVKSGGATTSRPNRESDTGSTQVITDWYEDALYNPVVIDNFAIKKSKTEDENAVKSSYFLSTQAGYYTEQPETIQTIIGDYAQYTLGIPTRRGGTDDAPRPSREDVGTDGVLTNNLYAIYTSDNSYSKLWYEYGQSTNQLSFTLSLTRTILKAYQKPARFYHGDFKSDSLDILSVISFVVPGSEDFFNKMLFVWINADFDLMHNTVSGTLRETFTKQLVIETQTVPVSGTNTPPNRHDLPIIMGTPPVIQNPNSTSTANLPGVFDDEFTDTFL